MTSSANRTSPVQRGKWILENVLGVVPPAPPAGVETNLDVTAEVKQPVTLRQRMEQHRANPVCASCHKVMDPIGFSMENFDLVGKWRDREGKTPIDATGSLSMEPSSMVPSASAGRCWHGPIVCHGGDGEVADLFAGPGAKLYRHARGVRAIVRDAQKSDYRFSSLVLAITRSQSFQMRVTKTQPPKVAELR